LIIRLENQKVKEQKIVIELKPANENHLMFILMGKVFAFDFCIHELRRVMEYNELSKRRV